MERIRAKEGERKTKQNKTKQKQRNKPSRRTKTDATRNEEILQNFISPFSMSLVV